MARKVVAVVQPIEEQAEEWLHDTKDDYLVCRGQGHIFPKIRPGRRLPRGISAYPFEDDNGVRDGSYQVTFTCPTCGTVRTLTTLPGGQFDYPAKYSYQHPKGYKIPKGSEIGRRDCFMETWRRATEDAALLALEAPPNGHVPQVEFRKGD